MNTFNSQSTLKSGATDYEYFSLENAEKAGAGAVSKLPFSLKVMLENLLRFEDGQTVSADDIRALVSSPGASRLEKEMAFRPARVLMQDFTGVPAIVDLATMRDVIKQMGGDPKRINPLQPVELVIDHSVQVDDFGSDLAFRTNADLEFTRNRERYQFLRWGQKGFRKKTGAEIAGDIKQASQEAPEAIEQQRIPKAAREMMKGYYEKMRQQAEKELKTEPKK